MDGSPVRQSANLILLGAPGAGKGTQARLLAERFGLTQISTGELLREAAKAGTQAGAAAAEIMQRGDLVPDEIVTQALADRLDAGDVGGVIFDGYPRSVAQAHALDALLAARGRTITAAISLDVYPESIAERICGRFTCSTCGEGYHDRFKLPQIAGECEVCGGGDFSRRVDDTTETVLTRLATYAEQTAPVEEFYANRALLKKTDAMGAIGAVASRLSACVEEALA